MPPTVKRELRFALREFGRAWVWIAAVVVAFLLLTLLVMLVQTVFSGDSASLIGPGA